MKDYNLKITKISHKLNIEFINFTKSEETQKMIISFKDKKHKLILSFFYQFFIVEVENLNNKFNIPSEIKLLNDKEKFNLIEELNSHQSESIFNLKLSAQDLEYYVVLFENNDGFKVLVYCFRKLSDDLNVLKLISTEL